MEVSSLLLLFIVGGTMGSFVDVPKLALLDGRKMPAIGLGTYLGFDKNGVVTSKNKELRDVVMDAIDMGYRHFDTASIYNTEAEVGEGINMKIDEGVVRREDVFVTTKLWNTHHKREQVAVAMRETLNQTGLDYVDLYLMHWPIGLNEDYSHSDVDFMETWRGMEEMYRLGFAKSLGVSNFNKQQLQRVLDEGTVKPVALQVEVHPQIIQEELINFCKSEDIVVMGYSPFGSLVMRYGMQFPGPKMDDPVLVNIAQKYGKTTAQVVLRWLDLTGKVIIHFIYRKLLFTNGKVDYVTNSDVGAILWGSFIKVRSAVCSVDRNVVPIPKTVNPKRLAENINIFDFHLEQHEIEKINQFDSHTRFTLPSFWQSHPYYPFEQVKDPIADPFRG